MVDKTMLTSDPATESTRELQRLTIAQLLGRQARETPEGIAIVVSQYSDEEILSQGKNDD
jgi:hypothetical protein